MLGVVVALLTAGEHADFDSYASSRVVYQPGDGLSLAARALLESAHVSDFDGRRGVPDILWAPPAATSFRGLTAEQAARRHLFTWAPV